MKSLEKTLDCQVRDYVAKLEDMNEIKTLLSGEVSRKDYVRLLKTFYVIEHISQRAVLRASKKTQSQNPYLSKRFKLCAKGELGHAEIALKDLEDMNEQGRVGGVDLANIPFASDYDDFLQGEAGSFPLGILGHSYLFENASGIIFPKCKPLDYPSRFVEVHAKEDPAHSLAIKRTVRKVEAEISDRDLERIASFTNKSGDYLLKLFENMGS